VLRTHRIGVGLYDLVDGSLVRRERIDVDVSGERTELPQLAGVPVPEVLLLNDDDLTYAKLRLDERSLATVVRHLSGFESSLARALCWAAAWDMVRDAEMPARDYVALALGGLPAEGDINLVTATLRQVASTLAFYADPAWAPTGWANLADTARAALDTAAPGSGFQLAWARAYAAAVRRPEELAVIRGWLDGAGVPDGLTVDTELRWVVLHALAANGAAGEDQIEAELNNDRTASGEREAAQARALLSTPQAKAEAWRRLTGDQALPNWLHRALLQGFQHPAQVELTAPYAERFFEVVADVWARRDSEQAQEFVVLGYPAYQVSDQTVAATDRWLAQDGHPASLRRLIAEGKDGVLRALRARNRDATAG
jgi:aminopeptidase N